MNQIPFHLKKYVVSQNYERYTPIDQAVWRYIMRQLKSYLATKAHPCYLEGLVKTGISSERIPNIEEMSQKLSLYGWRAIAVSGFIPPAAFMELQALGFLPIASDIRTLEHLEYTPAPDIVHEAAGHAPILINPDFSSYLKAYAQISRKAILSERDLAVYEAIRDLSDLKEDPGATESQVAKAYEKLELAKSNADEPSEAALLGRMNWWTAEYGLIGTMEAPKIYGAGLLSSVGESRWCFDHKVKKIPMSVECIEFNYDITEPQPQLFVVREFHDLTRALEQMAEQMAFRRGGTFGLQRALEAGTVNTVELGSGLQVSGKLTKFLTSETGDEAIYLNFSGPCQLSFKDQELEGQGKPRHESGFSLPVGRLKNWDKCLSEMTAQEMEEAGIAEGETARLLYASGVVLEGKLVGRIVREQKCMVLTFEDCTVEYMGEKLFRPEWGPYDLAVGSHIPSVFGGPADRQKFGEVEDFAVKRVPLKEVTPERRRLNELYSLIRGLRERLVTKAASERSIDAEGARLLNQTWEELNTSYPQDWLLRLEVLELLEIAESKGPLHEKVQSDLKSRAQQKGGEPISDGLALVTQL